MVFYCNVRGPNFRTKGIIVMGLMLCSQEFLSGPFLKRSK